MQLMQIRTKPIQLEYTTTPAKFEIVSNPKVSLEVVRSELKIPAKTFNNIPIKQISFSQTANYNKFINYISDSYQRGQRLSYDVVSVYGQEGAVANATNKHFFMDIKINSQNNPFIPYKVSNNTPKMFSLTNNPRMIHGSSDPILSLEFEFDTSQTEIKPNFTPSEFEFTPGEIAILISQYPEVIIEYGGEPFSIKL